MKILQTLALAAAMTGAAAAHADSVTSGSMSRVLGGDVIEDSLNQREWLGADVTRGLTYAQTLDAIASGGQFEGYSIAGDADALMFQAAFSDGTQSCSDDYGWTSCTGDADASREAVFGKSYFDYASYGYTFDYSYFWFQGDNPDAPVGYVELYSDTGLSSISVNHAWSTIDSADWYAGDPSSSIGWLLYRSDAVTTDVPEPGSLALAGLALAGVTASRRRAVRG